MRLTKIFTYLSVIIALLTSASCALLIPAGIIGTASIISDNRSVGMQIDDKFLSSKVRTEIKLLLKNDSNHLNISVLEGRVMVTGCVTYLYHKKLINSAAWSVLGVKEVINETKVCTLKNNDIALDVILANKIRAMLILEKKVGSSNYSIECIDSTIYILGIAANLEEKQKVLAVIKTASGIKAIVSHIILANDPRRWNRI